MQGSFYTHLQDTMYQHGVIGAPVELNAPEANMLQNAERDLELARDDAYWDDYTAYVKPIEFDDCMDIRSILNDWINAIKANIAHIPKSQDNYTLMRHQLPGLPPTFENLSLPLPNGKWINPDVLYQLAILPRLLSLSNASLNYLLFKCSVKQDYAVVKEKYDPEVIKMALKMHYLFRHKRDEPNMSDQGRNMAEQGNFYRAILSYYAYQTSKYVPTNYTTWREKLLHDVQHGGGDITGLATFLDFHCMRGAYITLEVNINRDL
jgi:hypothetical protein